MAEQHCGREGLLHIEHIANKQWFIDMWSTAQTEAVEATLFDLREAS